MYMWDSTTCACRTVLDVHVKQGFAPGKGTLLTGKGNYSELTKVSSPDAPPYAGSKGSSVASTIMSSPNNVQ